MALTSPPTAVAPFDSGYLSAGITAGATTITVSPIVKTVNGVNVKQGFDTTSGLAVISQGDYFERISFEGSSVNATTKVTTLTGVTRGLSVNSTTTSFSGGTGRIWRKGANITVVADASYFQSAAFKAVANTWTATQTFSAPVIVSGSTSYVKLPSMTEAQRDALTASNGMAVYVTDGSNANRIHTYEGGAWGASSSTTVADGSETVAGKFEGATLAEHATATETGGTGSKLVVLNKNLVKTSNGASDENKIPVLDSSGKIPSGFLTTDTNIVYPYGDGSDGALNVTSGTTTLDFAGANVLIKNYSSINVSVGATLTVSNTPASGGLLVLLCTGTTTIAGTLDLKGKGSTGGAQVSLSVSASTFSISNGNQGTEPFLNAGQTRRGGAGIGAQNAATPNTAASGGAGASSTPNSGANSTTATSGSASAAAATAGTGLTAVLASIASSIGVTLAPGAGGSTGGVAISITSYGSGTATATSGAGGAGGGALLIASKGNLSLTGTIDLRGNDATASTAVANTATGNVGCAAGGSSGGAGGTGLAYTKGTITSGGTYSVAAGAAGAQATATNGVGTAAATAAGASGAGAFIITKTIF